MPSNVQLDHAARRLLLGSTEVALTHLEFELLTWVWNYATAAGDRAVDCHVRRLRRKLAGAWTLTTVRGYGYRFDGWQVTTPATVPG